MASTTLKALALTAALAAGFATQAGAQETNFAGKVIRIVVSGGGAYEAYARLVARHMPAFIPGKPSMIVQEMPGNGGIRAASFLHNIAPKDGTVIGAIHGAVITAPLLQPSVVDFDVTKFNWIGNATEDVYIGYVTAASPVHSLEEAKTKEWIVGGTSLGSSGIDMAIIGKELFGLKLKIIPGYRTSDETKLAMERGEIQGTMGSTWGSLKTSDLLRRKAVKVILQHGAKPHPELKDIPLFGDLARNETEKQMLDVMRVRGEIAKPYLTPPGVPAPVVGMFRQAFTKTMADKGFVDEVNRLNLEFDQPMDGVTLQAEVERISKTSPQAIGQLTRMLNAFNDGKK
jgi:tripartite-type tricarboxylate transporter receptor subunit TctC